MGRKNYGLPYKGSKNKIAEDIISVLPKKKILVDLFGGGGAISDCAIQSGKYEQVIYNELDTIIADTFRKALNGEYENEKRWISREDFNKLKDTDGYVAICFSFSNDCKTYMYGPKIEPYKRAYHYAVVLDDFQPLSELFDEETVEKLKKSVEGLTDTKQRRLAFTRELGKYILGLMEEEEKNILKHTLQIDDSVRNAIQNEQRKEQINTLKHTVQAFKTYVGNVSENLLCNEKINGILKNTIEILNNDYADVELPSPSECIVYCDIPYENTNKYKMLEGFDYQRFYKWVEEKKKEGYEIYVSSYELPEDKFTEVWSKEKYGKMSGVKGRHTIEKLFTPK